MNKNPVIDARDLVAELFPQARWAILTGSVFTPARTAGSDLDILVLLPDGDPRAPRRDSRRYRGWPVELFVHDERSLGHQLAKELGARKPYLHRMVGTGIALVGDPGAWREPCAEVVAGGSPSLTRGRARLSQGPGRTQRSDCARPGRQRQALARSKDGERSKAAATRRP
jgi:hypothetical protein